MLDNVNLTTLEREQFSNLLAAEKDEHRVCIHFYFGNENIQSFTVTSFVVPRKGDIVSVRELSLTNPFPTWENRRDRAWKVKQVYILTFAAVSEKDILLEKSSIYSVEVHLKPVIYWKNVLKTPWWRLKRYYRYFRAVVQSLKK